MLWRGIKQRKYISILWVLLLAAGMTAACQPSSPAPAEGQINPTSPPPTITRPPATATLANTPEPTLTSTPVQLQACVETRSLRVRSGPGTEHTMVGGLKEGDCVTVRSRNKQGTWAQVSFQNISGWVSLEYLIVQGEVGSLAVVTGQKSQEASAALQPTQPAAAQPPPLTATAAPGSTHINVFTGYEGSQVNTFSFEYACTDYTLDLPLSETKVRNYASRDKSFYYTGELPQDWEKQYYEQFLEGEYDSQIITSTIVEVRSALGIKDDDDLVMALTSLVQHIEYDCDKLFSYENLDDHDYQTNFPLETLFRQKGVCGDFSILLGKMLQEAGYGAAFLLYNEANHMALGLRCPAAQANYIHQGVGYCYIETTGPARIGVKPRVINGMDFREEPLVIPISRGKSFQKMASLAQTQQVEEERYGEYILQLAGCQEISRYKSVKNQEYELYGYEDQLDEYASRMDSISAERGGLIEEYNAMDCEGELPQEQYEKCSSKADKIEALRRKYNNLVRKYNNLYDKYERHYQGYVADFDLFQDLMDETYKSCATVSRDDLQPEGESEGQDG